MAGDTPPLKSPRQERGQRAWSVLLNSSLVAAFVLGAIVWAFAHRWILEPAPSERLEAIA